MNRNALAALLLLAGCSRSGPPPRAPLAGAAIGGPFVLVDQDGRRVTDRDFAGRDRIVYFGYTSCPDVCPTDMQAVGAGLKLVERERPALGARVVPIFITVDPARDTPSALKPFVAAFHARMVGLTGPPDAIARAAKEYAVSYQRGDALPGGGYVVGHTRAVYLMDPAGRPLALLPSDEGARAVADAIERWAA